MADTRGGRAAGKFAAYAWVLLGYNVLVILWGAVVRATGSGAGCGEHWPLCQGRMIPHAEQIATLIEFLHRATSGIDVLLVIGLVALAFRWFGRGHAVRRYATATGVFTLTEGLVGAALVLFGEVGKHVSAGRVAILSVHLTNTFLLLASLALTAWAASRQHSADLASAPPTPPAASKSSSFMYSAGLLGALAIAITGTIAALADTLFPAHSLAEAVRWDFSGAAAPLLHLRIIHPVVAVLVGAYLLALAFFTLHSAAPTAARKFARGLIALVFLQFSLGVAGMLLLVPLWVQVLHLLTADLIWITLVLLAAEALGWRAGIQASPLSMYAPPGFSAASDARRDIASA